MTALGWFLLLLIVLAFMVMSELARRQGALVKWRYFEVWWDNGFTRGIRVGATGAPFFLMICRGINPPSAWNFNSNDWPAGKVAGGGFRWYIGLVIGTDPCAPVARHAAPWAKWHVKLRVRLMRLVDRKWTFA